MNTEQTRKNIFMYIKERFIFEDLINICKLYIFSLNTTVHLLKQNTNTAFSTFVEPI